MRDTIQAIRARAGLTQERLAQVLGVSFVSVNRWERGASAPSPAQARKIQALYEEVQRNRVISPATTQAAEAFASRGIKRRNTYLPLFDEPAPEIVLIPEPLSPILPRLTSGRLFGTDPTALDTLLRAHSVAAQTTPVPPDAGMSAGKNTYTYDAHTYHTKVPPQGISELLRHYLPDGGLVLDPFAGSGMTGVACRVGGYDCILNELSPAACFIADRFVTTLDPARFDAAVASITEDLQRVRADLYTTFCRECNRPTEILYTVWSYRVLCSWCDHEFSLWDHCRSYGATVREHKIVSEFLCPACRRFLVKSQLRRTIAEPVQIGYMCCGSRQQEVVHPPDAQDLALMYRLEIDPPLAEGFYPTTELPDGVNLRQPKRHGLDRIDRFYTPRNLAAMSHLWRAVHRIEDVQLAAHLAFVVTSLYQRVTRLSEFRFWGGSGNTARFNVPFIFNESNVFRTFARKAGTIRDHLETTASNYRGMTTVVQGSATSLSFLSDDSIDLIFTDPPFGGNINYSEMNILWESWFGSFTDTEDEAIINKAQGKTIDDYTRLMFISLRECYRVLRPDHWLLLVFMNSSGKVWDALKDAIERAGFEIRKADVFDKQHGTFKQHVSENTAGADLVLHCLKPGSSDTPNGRAMETVAESIAQFLDGIDSERQTIRFLHVEREDEIDFRSLYSEWTARVILQGGEMLDFPRFRSLVIEHIRTESLRSRWPAGGPLLGAE